MNAFVLLPWYAENFFGGMEPILQAGAAVNGSINSVFTFVMICVAPFNLIKGVLVSIVTWLLYKRVSGVIKHYANQ